MDETLAVLLPPGAPILARDIMGSMVLTINGEERTFGPLPNVAALVEQLGMKSDRVAVELNRDIVPRPRWSETPLKDGDRLEIVHFVGGGAGI